MTKVLLVEDDNNLREIYEARLQAEGYTIVSARDGEEALVVAKAEKPDLIISDIMMPKISGFEMLDILRNTDELKAVKIIMLTALGQSDDQQRADKLGADRYLVKSQVTLEDIVRVAHELLSDASGAPAPVQAATDPTAPDPAATPAPAAASPAPGKAPETAVPTTDAPVAEPAPASPAPDPTATAQPVDNPAQNVTDTSGSANGALSTAGLPSASNTPAADTTPSPSTTSESPAIPVSTAPEPAADPAATTPAESVTAPESPHDTTTPTPELTADQKPETTAQEEAKLEAQIEDFVAGAEEQPNVASAPAEPATENEPTPPITTPETPAVQESNSEPTPGDISEGSTAGIVEDQASGAPSLSPSEKAEAEMAVEQADAALVDSAVKTLEDNSTEQPGTETEAEETPEPSENEKKGGERVIQPLDSEPKTDINELLAKEEAQAAQTQATEPGSTTPAASAEQPATGIGPSKVSPRPPTAPGQVDPNSIAL